MLTTIIKTPTDYDFSTAIKMVNAGLIRIEQDFEYDQEFTTGSFKETRYVFNDGVETDPKKFRKRVYNWITK